MKGMDDTLHYYEINAESFAKDTIAVDFSETQDRFLKNIPQQGMILDFGCGAGRDTKRFLQKGYQVEAVDGSAELCRIASDYTGISVHRMRFEELDTESLYDGIWACASILHLPKDDLRIVFAKMIRAVKSNGYIYTSFKYGTFEGYRKGRYFTDFTNESFGVFVGTMSGVNIFEEWISSDVRHGREDEKWLNIILQKN